MILYEDGASYPDLVELSSKLHAVEAMEVHYQLHSTGLKSLLQLHGKNLSSFSSSSPSPSPSGPERDRKRVEAEAAIAEALVHLKGLPLCQDSYPTLWEWTKQVCREAFTGSPATKPHPHSEEEGAGATEKPHPLGGIPRPLGRGDLLDIASKEVIVGAEEMDVGGDEKQVPYGHISEKSHDMHGRSHDLHERSRSVLQLCLYGIAICAVRCPAFFKPLYRLATTLHAIGLTSVRHVCSKRISL